MAKYTNTMFVFMFPDKVQASIKRAIAKSLSYEKLTKEEYKEAMENAMGSRLVDLDEAIDTKRFLDMANGRLVLKPAKNVPLYKLTYNTFYSRHQTGDLIYQIQSASESTVFSKARDELRKIIKDNPKALWVEGMVHVHKYNPKTKRFRKVYVVKYDYKNKKVVGQSFDDWRQNP